MLPIGTLFCCCNAKTLANPIFDLNARLYTKESLLTNQKPAFLAAFWLIDPFIIYLAS